MFLIYDPEHRGHHAEFLENLISELGDTDQYVMYASPFLQDRLEASKKQIGSRLRIEYLDRKWTNQLMNTHNWLKRGWIEAEMARKLANSESATHLLFMHMNMNQFYLGVRGRDFPCFVSGIIMNHYTPLYRSMNLYSKLRAAFTATRKLLMYRWMLQSGKVSRVYILNDLKVANWLNKKFKQSYFRSVPDPLPYFLKPKGVLHYKSPKTEVSKKVFLLAGSLALRKGCLELFDALRLLPASLHQVIQIRVLGRFRTNTYRKAVESAARQLLVDCPDLELELRAHFLTNEDFIDEVNTCDFVLAPYLGFYGSSGILGHAAFAEKPVLCCRDGLLGEIVSERRLGLTFDPSSKRDFAAALELVLSKEVDYDADAAKDYVAEQSAAEFCHSITNYVV